MRKTKKQERPDIERKVMKKDGKVVEMIFNKIIRPHGKIGYIPMPLELVGKYVRVQYKEDEKYDKEVKANAQK